MTLNPARLIFPRLDINQYINDKNYKDAITNFVEIGVGGFCIFSAEISQLILVINELNQISHNELLYLADFEYGTGMRISDGNSFPHAKALGKYNDTEVTKNVAYQIGLEMKALGVHWNLAPVADINSNVNNPIINIRSFGEDADIVSAHSIAFCEGLNLAGIINCVKHFPGHGDTDVDSHSNLPVLNKSLKDLENLELKPFTTIVNHKKADAVMLGHLAVSSLTNDNLPASISPIIIGDVLREKLGFEGLVMSDALDMNPIAQYYSTGDAVELAIKAGIDLLLMPQNPLEAISKILHLSKVSGYEQKINNSLSKLTYLKEKYNTRGFSADAKKYDALVANSEKLGLQVALNTLDLTVNKSDILPIDINKRVACFAIIQTENDIKKATNFFNFLSKNIENDINFAFIDENISDEDIDAYRQDLGSIDTFIFAVFFKSRAYQNSIGNAELLAHINSKLSQDAKEKISIFFGNPYLANSFDSDLIIKTYSDSKPSIVATTLVLAGKDIDPNYLKME